ncbi:hypothetical protein J4Q44_G00251610 [Coregonus suidteri]|uniref:Uncharacterized protein n=1 Tax=Coregonus suidteri TaxID=861788 RepID=A0AAN8L8K8_9TELE
MWHWWVLNSGYWVHRRTVPIFFLSSCFSLCCPTQLRAWLDPEKHLGKPLADMEPYLTQLSQKYGEGGR